MNYFDKYYSNTLGAAANQSVFTMGNGEARTSRAFFKIFAGGEYEYSLLFSDTIDSTFADGSVSKANDTLGDWEIISASVYSCPDFPECETPAEVDISSLDIRKLCDLSFGKERGHRVNVGEVFSSDPITLSFKGGEYAVIELTYTGKRLPYHPESMLPIYEKCGGVWRYSTEMPLPVSIGCDRKVNGRIAYLGDSITQGIGAGYNTYKHWCALLSDMLGDGYAYYNLGIGYARASDAALDGAWLERAKNSDVCFVCLGTNDVTRDEPSTEKVCGNLTAVVDALLKAGVRVILQTAPPFDRVGNARKIWFELNDYITSVLSDRVELLFDNVPHLRLSENDPDKAKFGGHPSALGCEIWAKALYESVKDIL